MSAQRPLAQGPEPSTGTLDNGTARNPSNKAPYDHTEEGSLESMAAGNERSSYLVIFLNLGESAEE